jgi:hypothetical protein
MESRAPRPPCDDCPLEPRRANKIKKLVKAIKYYDYCKYDLFKGEPLLSDVEEAMVAGFMAQQETEAGEDSALNSIRFVVSLEESAGANDDFFYRVVCWTGMEGQRREIARLEQEAKLLACDIPC